MRIISGIARGTKLYTVEGLNTRPTLDRVKESVFNIIQNKISGCVFLDLFTGSGAIGLEAVSRGAKEVILCDKSKDAIKTVRKNVIKTHFEEKTIINNCDYKHCLNSLKGRKIDIVYLDPPYKTNLAEKAIDLIMEYELLHKESWIIVETDNEGILKKVNNIETVDVRKYGRAIIMFLKIK